VDLIGEGFDCAIRVGYLPDSNLIARRVGPMFARFVASPGYIKAHGSPETPEELVAHQALLQGTEAWRLMDGDATITVQPGGGSKPIMAQPSWPPRWRGSASRPSPTASSTNMWPRARSFRSCGAIRRLPRDFMPSALLDRILRGKSGC